MAIRDYIVFDFETGSRNPRKTQPTQIAALALDGRNFKLKGTFNREIRPVLDDEKAIEMGFDPLEDEALRITGKNREDLAKAPLPKTVWKKFCDFVNQHNWKGTQFFAPIPAGFNIIGFDMIIVDRLCKAYGPYDKERQQQKLFNKIYKVDMMDNMFTGKIEEVIYHGDHTRVRLNLLGSSEFILKVPNSTSNLELKVSQDINIGWNSVDARALDPK